MLRLVSLAAIISAPAAALVYAGHAAFATPMADQAASPLHAFFQALPADTAYGAPLVAIALVAAAYFLLRLIGFAVAVIGGGAIVAMIVMVFFKPEWIETLRQLVVAGPT